jgi:hypothetical protein
MNRNEKQETGRTFKPYAALAAALLAAALTGCATSPFDGQESAYAEMPVDLGTGGDGGDSGSGSAA